MRFTYAEAMTDPSYYLPLAQAAEAAGYDSISVADSIAYPEVADSTYPYTADGSRELLEDKAFIETFVLIAAMSAVTTTLRFTRFVLKLPIRPPVLVAKQASSIACLSGNRLGLGVGVSPWPASIKLTPAPTQPIPLLVGGHSEAALRRAVVHGDGWMHGGGPNEDLDELLDSLAKIRHAEGKADEKFEIHVISLDAYSVDGIKRLEDKGVTDVIVGFRIPYGTGPDSEPLQRKIEHLQRYSEHVIAKVKG